MRTAPLPRTLYLFAQCTREDLPRELLNYLVRITAQVPERRTGTLRGPLCPLALCSGRFQGSIFGWDIIIEMLLKEAKISGGY